MSNKNLLYQPLIATTYRRAAGADPGFQVRGGALKKLHRAEGGAKNFGVFRVKNHDFTPKNHIFSNFRGRAPDAPPSGSAPELLVCYHQLASYNSSQHLLGLTITIAIYATETAITCMASSFH